MRNYAIILASGSGSRFGGGLPKQFCKINNKTIFERSIEVFENAKNIDRIIVVITPEYIDLARTLMLQNGYKKIYKIIAGGEQRKDSSFNGVTAIEDNEANILIHDCARPFVTEKIINDCINALKQHDAVGVAIPSTDTVIEVENSTIKRIPPRKNIMRIQTPQCFKLSLIKKAHELSKNNKEFTDDCGLVIKYGLSDIYIVEGDRYNIKITYPEDIYFAEKIL